MLTSECLPNRRSFLKTSAVALATGFSISSLTLALQPAADLTGSGVRVNSILPPDDIARVILFLCSDDARVIHGAAIPVYGDS